MAEETILQNEIFTNFALPFLLIFFIFGEGKKQLNALVAFVIGLIFVAAVFPKLVVGNLILFLTIAIVVMFVALLLWGFVSGQAPKIENTPLKWVIGIVIVVAVGIALLWAMGIEGGASDLLFEQSWSGEFWTNAAFVVVVIVALVLAMKTGSKSE
jgi:hypothetical protein